MLDYADSFDLFDPFFKDFHGQSAGVIGINGGTPIEQVASGICGITGLNGQTILNNTSPSPAVGAIVWQVSTNGGTTWATASGTSNAHMYNPGSTGKYGRHLYRRSYLVVAITYYSNIVVFNAQVGATAGTLSWAGGRNCIQQNIISLVSSGVPSSVIQFSWQYRGPVTPPTNTCTNICDTSGSWSEQSGTVSGTGTGTVTANSNTWTFTPPGIYCKRETYALYGSTGGAGSNVITDSMKCYTTDVQIESTWTTSGDASDNGPDRTLNAATTFTGLRTNAAGYITNADGAGTWSYKTSSLAFPDTTTWTGTTALAGDNPNFTFGVGSAHYYVFRYIQSGGTCCNDTSYFRVQLSQSLPLEVHTFGSSLYLVGKLSKIQTRVN